ncbi:MAG: rod shape-determining protein MreD [Pseudomonadota bacterium]
MGWRSDMLGRWVRAAAPAALGALGVLLLALPIRLGEGLAPTPLLPLIVVYFWAIYGPHYLPAPAVFLIGVAQDFLIGGPLGLWPLTYLIVQYLVINQRSYFLGREQQVVWMGFSVIAVGVGLLLWAVHSAVAGAAAPRGPLAVQILATIATYPLFARAFAQVHRRVIIET